MSVRIPLALAFAGAVFVAGCASTSQDTPSTTTPATRPAAQDSIDADAATLVVYGMSCPQCATNVRLQLLAVPGVRDVSLDLGNGEVKLSLLPRVVRRSQLRAAIEDSGFTLKSIRVG